MKPFPFWRGFSYIMKLEYSENFRGVVMIFTIPYLNTFNTFVYLTLFAILIQVGIIAYFEVLE